MIKTNPKMTAFARRLYLCPASIAQPPTCCWNRFRPSRPRRSARQCVDLGEVASEEQHRILEEFRRMGTLAPTRNPPGIELDDSLAQALARPPERRSGDSEAIAHGSMPRSDFSARRRPKSLPAPRGGAAADDRPGAFAPAAGAGRRVLARLQPALQVEVIRRLVDLEETDPEILREVEAGCNRGFRQRSADAAAPRWRADGGGRDPASVRRGRPAAQILDNLAAHDRALAERLGPGADRFDDLLADLDDELLARGARSGRSAS